MTANYRRLIENWLPIKEISVEAVRKGGALWPGTRRSISSTSGGCCPAGRRRRPQPVRPGHRLHR